MVIYRKDNRTEKEFADDIAACTAIEYRLMQAYVKDLCERTKKEYKFIDNGVDNTGAYQSDDSKITTDADFILINPRGTKRKIEIKFSRVDTYRFHLKTNQITSYIKQDCCIIMFMGIETDNCRYCIITPKDCEIIQETAEKIKLWHKDVYRLKNKDFIWYPVKLN